MNQYILTQNETVYKIELDQPKDISDFVISSVEVENDRFKKYKVVASMTGYMYKIENATHNESNIYTRVLGTETYSEYLKHKNIVSEKNTKWIYNIIHKISEQENILYRDNDCVVIPTYTWNGDMNKLHILGIVTDQSLMTIRDLHTNNVSLLEHIREKGLQSIKNKYNIDRDIIRTYIHYPPSTWLLHIHFEVITNISDSCVTEYCHNVSHVIYNLTLDNNYYQNMTMDILK
jgi:hypothetical protein